MDLQNYICKIKQARPDVHKHKYKLKCYSTDMETSTLQNQFGETINPQTQNCKNHVANARLQTFQKQTGQINAQS